MHVIREMLAIIFSATTTFSGVYMRNDSPIHQTGNFFFFLAEQIVALTQNLNHLNFIPYAVRSISRLKISKNKEKLLSFSFLSVESRII